MTLETVFWIASCTKLITAIACMQLVEQGKLSLDDADQAEKLCPQLKQAKILKGFGENSKPIIEPKKTGITLRCASIMVSSLATLGCLGKSRIYLATPVVYSNHHPPKIQPIICGSGVRD
jgi:hypothetical protein